MILGMKGNWMAGDDGAIATHGRAPWPAPDQLDDAQRAYYEALTAGPRRPGALTDSKGRLVGPFNAHLLDPAVGTALQSVGAALRFGSAMSARERELVILTVADAESSSYEWKAHTAEALRVGLSETDFDQVSQGGWGEWSESEMACVELARELLATADVADESFDRMVAVIGTAKIFDVVTLVGYYRLMALALHVWRVPLSVD